MAERIGPEYQRLIDVIREWIASGQMAVGSKIPSTAELHEMTGLSVPVVRRAVGQLETDGILEGHPGKGVYVRATPADADAERQSLKTLSAQIAELREMVEERDGHADLAAQVGRIEANLIALYGQLGKEYPRGGSRDRAKAAAGGGRR